MARHGHAADKYGTPAPAPAPAARSNRFHRPAILANHALHWLSSIIVLGISAYFIHKFTHNTHLRYWVSIAAIDTILYFPAILLPAVKSYKGYLAPLAWIFSYLWLTAFIFASQDYNFNGGSFVNSPADVNKPALKKTLEAFTFIAFLTSLIGFVLESKLWDKQRFKGHSAYDTNEHHASTRTGAPATSTSTV